MNIAILSGRLVRDVELKFVPSTGMAIASFTLAVDKDLWGDNKQKAINEGKPTADFIQIKVFGKIAENCANFLSKGSKCLVTGRINTGSYTKDDGTKRYTTDVTASKVEFLDNKQDRQAQQQDDDVFTPTDENPFEDEPENELPF
jgi:single-strand DNA-binding protein